MPEMPPDPQRSSPNEDQSELSSSSMPSRSGYVDRMLLEADFVNFQESVGATRKIPLDSPAWKALQPELSRVQGSFERSSAHLPAHERVSAVFPTGGMTESGRSVLGLMEGLDPLEAKFALPADLLSLYSVSSTAAPLPVDIPGLEILDEPAGVVVSVDLDVRRAGSLALMLTRAAFEQAVCNLRQLASILQSRRQENPQSYLSSLPVASSLFALLFNEVYRREPPILGVKDVVGPSRNFLFQVSVVSLKEGDSNFESVVSCDGHLQVATHHIIVRQNDFGIVKPEWLGRVVAPI